MVCEQTMKAIQWYEMRQYTWRMKQQNFAKRLADKKNTAYDKDIVLIGNQTLSKNCKVLLNGFICI